jgi:predicted O-methyltransferase YrrM
MVGQGTGSTGSFPVRAWRSMRARTRDLLYSWEYSRRAVELARSCSGVAEPEELFRIVDRFEEFRPAQVASEFVGLMRLVAGLRPETSIEVGTATGGTSFLFTRVIPVTARLVTIDIADHRPRRNAVRKFALPGQAVSALCADSHVAATVALALEKLGASQVDFLFIDGDHSYEGVSRDFSLFSPVVRTGGLIAFHDIVEDHHSRYGKESLNRTGGVPKFWAELRARLPGTQEIIEDRDQDGYGIGVLRDWAPSSLAALHPGGIGPQGQ